MRHIWIAIALPFMLCATEPIDRTKPVYQMDWGIMPPGHMWVGGSWSQRSHEPTYKLTPKERAAIEASANAAMYRKAAYASWVLVGLACIASYVLHWKHGIGVAVICAAFSFASSFMASTAHYGIRIGICVVAVVAIALCFTPAGVKLFKRKEAQDGKC